MFRKRKILSCSFILLILVIIAGCAGKSKTLETVMEKLDFRYKMPEGQTLKYRTIDNFTQSMEIMGQNMLTEIKKDYVYSVNSKGQKENNFQLEFTIDSISMNVSSSMGNMTPDLSEVAGKSFEMTLSSLGKELEFKGLDKIKYTMGTEGERSISSDFQSVFPGLAGTYIAFGDSWTTIDTIKTNEGGIDMQIVITGENTLDGFEQMNERDCARIKVDYTGVYTSKGMQQGMEFTTTGNMKGKETWYFDYNNGIFVKMISKGNGTGIVVGSGPQEMKIPLMQEVEIETMLVVD